MEVKGRKKRFRCGALSNLIHILEIEGHNMDNKVSRFIINLKKNVQTSQMILAKRKYGPQNFKFRHKCK
jgi:hypothetical protein